MNRKVIALFALLMAVVMIGITSCSWFGEDESSVSKATNKNVSTTVLAADSEDISQGQFDVPSEREYVSYTFRTKRQFDEHFKKHGSEFGNITQEEYLQKANELINNDSDTILHKTEREDGDEIFYDTENNEILFLSTDGYIRTYFRPSQGIRYFNRQ